MHDPLTVAHQIRYPWITPRNRKSTDSFLRRYHDPFLTIWHRDPETDHTDDSCDWFWRKFTDTETKALYQIVDNPNDTIRHWFPAEMDDDTLHLIVLCIARHTRRTLMRRPWYRIPKWHVWHWRLQLHPWQRLQRWLFHRCATCGKRFIHESPVQRGKSLHHMACIGAEVMKTA